MAIGKSRMSFNNSNNSSKPTGGSMGNNQQATIMGVGIWTVALVSAAGIGGYLLGDFIFARKTGTKSAPEKVMAKFQTQEA